MDEREAFEKWLKESGSFTDWSRDKAADGPYHKPLTERAWQCWQSAAAWANADVAAGAVEAMRRWADEGLGFNCTFVDDDMKVVVGLAQRAVLSGLASDFRPEIQKRFTDAAEKHRASHEKSLGRALRIPE